MEGGITDTFARHWRRWLVVLWLAAAAWCVQDRWDVIRVFVLPDTDDNMRMMQVRALLAGQSWFDLRQYRLDPPFGANIHWSRLVDLPLAGIILAMRPFVGGLLAEKVAVTLAPMLPMAVGMGAIAVIARRLIAPNAYLVAIALLLCAHSTRFMWMPMRIDHHGWQLAFLSLVAAGLTDRQPVRGGLFIGLATGLSLTIGLELLLLLTAAGAIVGLMWVHDRSDAGRLAAYGATLSAGTGLGYLLFASYANRAPVCDALSPVWLSAMMGAGGLCVLLAAIGPQARRWRLALALGGAVLLAAAFAWSWPHCLGKLEGVSPEAQKLWLSNVREARPIYRQSWAVIVSFVSLALPGYAILLWHHRRDREMLIPWAALTVLATGAATILLWQTRAGPSAQLLAVPGAAGLTWLVVRAILHSRHAIVRVLGTVGSFLLISGLPAQFATSELVKGDTTPRTQRINRANRLCPSLAALHPVALLPRGYVLTMIDLSPRLITVTHHDAVTGPYHRNDAAIVDVIGTFMGTADHAHRMIERRGIDYVLICPNFSESTNYEVRSPRGFYTQLRNDKAPPWLQPIPLPANSPLKMWKVIKSGS